VAVLGGGRRGPAVGGRADRRLDHHRGRAAAVDRLRGDAGQPGGHGSERHPGRLRRADRGLPHPRRHRRRHLAPAGPDTAPARARRDAPRRPAGGQGWLTSPSRSSSPG
jgi:hypothetical protein